MTTHDGGSGSSSGPEDSLAAPPSGAGPELDIHGVPARSRSSGRVTYRLSLASGACSIVSIGLGITDLVAFGILAGYLVALGMASGFLGAALGSITWHVIRPESEPGRQGEVIRRICRAGHVLGILGFICLMIGSGNGAALNSAP
jgi:hypothetical protein